MGSVVLEMDAGKCSQRAGDLRWKQPTKFGVVINLKTAIGRTMPQSLLSRADEVIQ